MFLLLVTAYRSLGQLDGSSGLCSGSSDLGRLSCLGIDSLWAALGLSHPGNADSPPCGLSSSSKGAWACPYGSDRVPRESAGSVQGFLKPDLELERGHFHHILLAKASSRQPHIQDVGKHIPVRDGGTCKVTSPRAGIQQTVAWGHQCSGSTLFLIRQAPVGTKES